MPALSFLRIMRGISPFAFVLSFSGPLHAVCPRPHPRVCTEFSHSEAVFIGSVISVSDYLGDAEDLDGWVYQVKVARRFRGSLQSIVSVYTENSSGRFRLDVNHAYLLFASNGKKGLEITNCGNSVELSQAAETIRKLEQVVRKFGTATSGDIQGRIEFSGLTFKKIAGIRVVAQMGRKTYSGATDRDGWFRIRVPAGTYKVRPITSEWKVTPYDLSYDDPAAVTVPRGGCADVLFLADPK